MFKPCIVIPVYRHAAQLEKFLPQLPPGIPTIVIDDGNDAPESAVLNRLNVDSLLALSPNQGKGAAIIAGMKHALELGYTHALQVDADGQHNPDKIIHFLQVAEQYPDSLLNGCPDYDASVPKSRKIGRKITNFWVRLETGSADFADAMCGFRVYPLAGIAPLLKKGLVFNRLEGDVEFLVKACWLGIPVRALPVEVVYPEAGFSNFRLVRDNLRISLMHAMLICIKILKILGLKK